MAIRKLSIVSIGLIAAFVWTGCETEKKKGNVNRGSMSQSPGMTRARNMPKDQLYRVQIEDFICNAQSVNWPNKTSQTVQQLARALTTKFEERIVNSGAFIVVASQTSGDRDTAIGEVDRTSSDYYDQDTAVDFGRQQGAQYVMRGTLEALNITDGGAVGGGNRHFAVAVASTTYEVRLSCRMIELATGRIVYAAQGEGSARDDALIAGGGDQNFFVGGAFADNTPIQEVVDLAIDAIIEDLVDKAYR